MSVVSRNITAFVIGIDNLRLNRLARVAGAPISKGAGIDLLAKIGARPSLHHVA